MTVDHSTARTSAVSRRFAPFFLLFAPVALALTGCGAESEEVGAHGAAAPAMQVAAQAVESENIELTASLQGRTRPFAVSEVRPQVTGLIQKRLFEEGEAVEEGTPLYQIEDSEYRAAVESASASLARARANANVAGQNAERLKGLVAIKAVSDQQYDEAEAAAAQARADVAMANAALTQAKINLDRTTIRAPISGKIGRSSVTPGALVTQNQASTLATIRQLDPLYVDLTAAATDVLRWKRSMASDLTSAETKVPVSVTLEDGSIYEHQGQLAFSEVSVDETSGTVVLRAIVPNPDGYLLPGMFVRASLPVGQLEGAILVSQAAVMRTPTAEPYVLVVGENGTAEQRMLTIAQARAGDWVVTDGLTEGSQVITSSLQILRPGAPVAAMEKTQENSSSNVANAAGNAALQARNEVYMAKYFIDRPVFAWVVAIIIMLAGVMALRVLPVSQYPEIAPPSVTVSAIYPGASAKAVEDSVTQVLERQMTGLDGLKYFSSSSSSSGASTVTLTFEAGTDPDIAQVQVQNKLSQATPLLPEQVQRQGVTVSKSGQNFLLVVGLVSPNGTHNQTDLADYAQSVMIDPVSRVDGVGNVQIFGAQYAMRIWINPDKLAQYSLTPNDVVNAIREQNTQVSSGSLGGLPNAGNQEISATITLQSLLSNPSEFENIFLKTTSDGAAVTVADVARVEMGAENYEFVSRWNGSPSMGFAIQLASGANALDTAEAVRHRVNELAANTLPADVEVIYPYDVTPFVDKSIHEVQKTLIEAIFLVFIVMLVFLQNLRATLVPMIAVPVVLLGTFAVLAAFGYSINVLTMFAMVLAIGLLVDDAIVVVENVERVMKEEGLSPREATRKSMDQITGALIGIATVLSAVFVPMAFFPGSTGIIYRQFSVTIVSAMILSVVVALVLSPALCATMLKSATHEVKGLTGRASAAFNRGFARMTDSYERMVSRILRRRRVFFGVFVALLLGAGLLSTRIPTSFLPNEDQGIALALVQLPPLASVSRTEEMMADVRDHILTEEEASVRGIFTISGFSFAGQGQNMGLAFIPMKDWSERDKPGLDVQSVANRSMGAFSQFTDGMAFTIVPPPIPELGTSSGFDLFLQDRGGLGHEALINARNQLLGTAGQSPLLMGVRPNGQDDNPQFNISIDSQKAQALGLSISDVNSTLSTALGGLYVNDFIDRGRIKRVFVQADAPFRMMPEDIEQIRVRNAQGEMIPLSAIATMEWDYGSPQLQRYNGVPAVQLQGAAAPGYSSGDAMAEMEHLIGQLPEGIGFEWTGLSEQEQSSGAQAPLLYALSVLIVFLCLAALYESWTVPVSVLLVMPLGIIGALVSAYFRGLSNDIFFQVGMLTTIGLASKNAILIVEFAKSLEEQGKELIEATKEAVRMRLRPILMTSLAFGFGVIPLALSSGAGAAARIAIGSAVLGGVIAATIFGIFFAPLFYVMIRKNTGARPLKRPGEADLNPSMQPAEQIIMKHIFVMTAATAFALTGCVSMAPDYERPDAPIASSLPAQTASDGVAAAGLGWRQFVADPALERLIDTALTNNRDLRVAILNVQAAQAQYGITRSQRFPSIDAQGTVTDRGLFEDDGASQNAALQAQSVDQATAQLAVTAYELDLFGRVTSLNRAAQQRYFAAEENARAAQLSLIGAVSNGWLGLVTNTQLLSLAQETASSQEESLNLTRARLEAGIASDLDYQRAVTSVEQARADTARYEAAVRQSLNALELLVGGPLPDEIVEAAAESEMSVRLDLYADQSSDILLSRPDVLAAENTLRAANAEIGAARAAFFPQISLTGSAGYASTELDNLFSSANGVWSYGPQVSLPIFSGGQNRANLRLAKAQREIALAQYEGAIQSAFRETADALAVADTIDDQIAALSRLVAASERAQFLSEQRLKDGVDDYLSVLDAQRAVYQAQQTLISARLERSRNAVALYLALGGGQAGSI